MFKPSRRKTVVGAILFSVYTLTFYLEAFSTVYSLLPFVVIPSFWLGTLWIVNFHDLKLYHDGIVKRRINIFLWVKFALFLINNLFYHFELISLENGRNNYWFYLYILVGSFIILAIDIYIVKVKPDSRDDE